MLFCGLGEDIQLHPSVNPKGFNSWFYSIRFHVMCYLVHVKIQGFTLPPISYSYWAHNIYGQNFRHSWRSENILKITSASCRWCGRHGFIKQRLPICTRMAWLGCEWASASLRPQLSARKVWSAGSGLKIQVSRCLVNELGKVVR